MLMTVVASARQEGRRLPQLREPVLPLRLLNLAVELQLSNIHKVFPNAIFNNYTTIIKDNGLNWNHLDTPSLETSLK